VGLLALLTASYLAGCGGGGGGSSGTTRVVCTAAGYVKDAATQNGISAATVTIGTRSALTTADGKYQITDLTSGNLVRSVRASGYSDYADTITITPGVNTLTDVYLADSPPPPP
jgi:hypothetical protein